MSALLSVEELDVHHGLLHAVRAVSFEVTEGERVALVGANGAGKTTLLRAIAGAQRASGGRVVLDGEVITDLPTHQRVRTGIALVPEGRRLFPDLTVEENLLVAGRRRRDGPWNVDGVLEIFPMLTKLRARRASTLSGGEQQATAIGRALMTNPRLLLLDEVSLGLAPLAVDAVYECLGSVLGHAATVLLVEQDLARALAVADRVICLLEGRIVLDLPAAEVSREQVTEAYFGIRGRPA
ncbi:ABC transporter ATP-binding protein [Amycolatopsis sp. K13G38]|uniref:ABC transporter ATP-binding protein n=1 Tax=Amycolatopsis acididurans TaxID=2724524 RepID=A0ABX1J296_9PSEU|nr:ABC transporter ATP-binding protein [Amycolatopsis acididurans]NKQ53094.1 ABC transporter ATP-binding protein [Amycolatopsis acididurans]